MKKCTFSAWVGYIVVGLAVLTYHILFFNRFFPIQEGWFTVYARDMLDGKIPYRDFFLFLQPLYPLEITTIVKLLGYNFIYLRIFGIVERLLLSTVLYLLFIRLFPVRYAVVAVLTTIAVYASYNNDVVYSYLQSCLCLGLFSLYLALRYLEKTDNRGSWIVLGLSGLSGGLSFLTKQSTGLMVSTAVFIILAFALARLKPSRFWMSATPYAIGFLLPLGVLATWLLSKGAFSEYIEQAYVGAMASKGALAALGFGFLRRAFLPAYLIFFGTLLSVSLLWLLLGRCLRNKRWAQADLPLGDSIISAAFGLGAGAAVLVPYLRRGILWNLYGQIDFYHLKLALVHACFYFSAFFAVYCLYRLLVGKYDYQKAQGALVAAGSFVIMYAHGLSFAIEEHAVAPSLGLLVGLLLSYKTPLGHLKNSLLALVCLGTISLCATQKYAWPYDWWGWREPDIWQSTEVAPLAYLQGFRLSDNTAETLTEITRLITENSHPNDNVFTFPNIPLFYILSDRHTNTFAELHYFDVCPDYVAASDSQRLLADPPEVIVYLDFPEWVWQFHENAFRNGAASGQRMIQGTVNRLVAAGDYALGGQFTTPSGYQIKVWVKIRQQGEEVHEVVALDAQILTRAVRGIPEGVPTSDLLPPDLPQ
jgi:Dolichyl-phosphate-mannose-protein mannosyltransferase